MPTHKQVTIQIRAPKGDDPGQISFGYYTLEGDVLIMTDGEKPVRRASADLVTHQLKPGEDPDAVARRLTKDFRRHIHGDTDFDRPLNYKKGYWL
jgi:hypothetical protein